jgi:competence protein ComEA
VVAPAGAASGAPPGPLDLNTATAEQLDALPGVGPATAEAILAYRQEKGRFRSVDELLEVRGIGEAKLASLRSKVTVR